MIKKLYHSQGIQGVLTLGYLYIVMLGILGEALYYSQLGINILNYSGITDVLLSPISKITSNFYVLGSLIGIAITLLSILNGAKTPEKKAMLKKWAGIKPGTESKTLDFLVVFLSIFLFSFYVGLDIGFGSSTAAKIKRGELAYKDRVVYSATDSANAKILGVNSSYLFYLTEDSPAVKISPVSSLKYFEKQPVRLDFGKLFRKSPSSPSGK